MQTVSNCMTSNIVPQCEIRAEPVKIQWDPSLPVFAKEEVLSAVGDEYGWLGGFDNSGLLRCFLPYTIIHKAGLRLVRFRIETIHLDASIDVLAEKSFLNSVVQYFRNTRADVIIPPTNNALFRTYPDGASPAPYGSYVIDLQQPEDILWKNIAKNTRQNITAAQKDGLSIREGIELVDPAYDLIRETFLRSKMGFMGRDTFKRLVLALGDNGKLIVAEHQGIAQSYFCSHSVHPALTGCTAATSIGSTPGQ